MEYKILKRGAIKRELHVPPSRFGFPLVTSQSDMPADAAKTRSCADRPLKFPYIRQPSRFASTRDINNEVD